MLSHELAHIRRGDWIVQLSAELLRAIYWFNPLLWLACRRLRLESEHACDDEVMSRGVEGTDYATHLIELARALNQRRHIWFPAPAMARPSSLERRVRAMLNVASRSWSHFAGHPRGDLRAALRRHGGRGRRAERLCQLSAARIADESGRGIPGTTVVLANEARQAKYEVKTNAIGRFEFVGSAGRETTASKRRAWGFSRLKDAVTVSGQNLQRNYTLKLGTLQETINVIMRRSAGGDPRAVDVQGAARMPDAQECVASGAGGQIVPPKKIRTSLRPIRSTLRGTGTSGSVVMQGRIALDGYLTDISVVGDAHPDLAQCGGRGGARVAATRRRC